MNEKEQKQSKNRWDRMFEEKNWRDRRRFVKILWEVRDEILQEVEYFLLKRGHTEFERMERWDFSDFPFQWRMKAAERLERMFRKEFGPNFKVNVRNLPFPLKGIGIKIKRKG